jgi:hypothetical protein
VQRSDNVFLLTLVDFLVQIIFFGLFVSVAYQASQEARRNRLAIEEASLGKLLETAGVSNFIELQDELGKLAPVRLKGFNQSLGTVGGGGDVALVKKMLDDSGGVDGLRAKLDQLTKLEQALGKPPCLSENRDGKRVAIPIATVVGDSNSLTFTGNTPQLQKVLTELGLSYERVRSLGLAEFRQTFQKTVTVYPNCTHTIMLRETTRLVDARDAAQSYFYAQIRR